MKQKNSHYLRIDCHQKTESSTKHLNPYRSFFLNINFIDKFTLLIDKKVRIK